MNDNSSAGHLGVFRMSDISVKGSGGGSGGDYTGEHYRGYQGGY